MSVSLISGLKSRQSTSRGGSGTTGSVFMAGCSGNHCLHLSTLVISLLGSSFCGLTMSCWMVPVWAQGTQGMGCLQYLSSMQGCRQQHLAAWGFCGGALMQAELLKKQGQFIEKPVLFICLSAVPFLWAISFLSWCHFCDTRALCFPLPLFGINPVVLIKGQQYFWLLTQTRDANRSFLIWLLSHEEN